MAVLKFLENEVKTEEEILEVRNFMGYKKDGKNISCTIWSVIDLFTCKKIGLALFLCFTS